jgi:hypothetical protein
MFLAQISRLIALTLAFCCIGHVASAYAATPSTSALGFTARMVKRSMRLNIKNSFDVATDATCRVDLYYSLSTVGEDTAGRVRKVASKTVKPGQRYARFIGLTKPVNLVSGLLQTQMNIQTLSTCGATRIYSNAVAENVTCDGGTSKATFTRTIKSKIS